MSQVLEFAMLKLKFYPLSLSLSVTLTASRSLSSSHCQCHSLLLSLSPTGNKFKMPCTHAITISKITGITYKLRNLCNVECLKYTIPSIISLSLDNALFTSLIVVGQVILILINHVYQKITFVLYHKSCVCVCVCVIHFWSASASDETARRYPTE